MIAYEYISTADNITLMRAAVDLSTPDGVADAVNLEGGTFVQSEDGDTWVAIPSDSEVLAVIEQARLQEEADLIAGLAAEHGTMVGQLVTALDAFGISLPTSLPDCMPVMYVACKSDPMLNADSQLAHVLYSQLLKYITDDDIYQVSQII